MGWQRGSAAQPHRLHGSQPAELDRRVAAIWQGSRANPVHRKLERWVPARTAQQYVSLRFLRWQPVSPLTVAFKSHQPDQSAVLDYVLCQCQPGRSELPNVAGIAKRGLDLGRVAGRSSSSWI